MLARYLWIYTQVHKSECGCEDSSYTNSQKAICCWAVLTFPYIEVLYSDWYVQNYGYIPCRETGTHVIGLFLCPKMMIVSKRSLKTRQIFCLILVLLFLLLCTSATAQGYHINTSDIITIAKMADVGRNFKLTSLSANICVDHNISTLILWFDWAISGYSSQRAYEVIPNFHIRHSEWYSRVVTVCIRMEMPYNI